jgi:hypothetical protein
MTTDHRMAMMYATQQEVIIAFAKSMSPIWLTVSNAVCKRGANGSAAMAGRTHADLPRAYGVVRH